MDKAPATVGAFFLRGFCERGRVPAMLNTPYLTLAEWAKLQGISRRKAEMLAQRDEFPAVRMRRKVSRTIWQKMVPADYKLA